MTRLSPLFTWRGAICDSALQPTSRHVALTLSLHMNSDGGSCHPLIETIAAETGLHYDTVRAHLRLLHELGWLRRELRRKGPGRGTRVEYTATRPISLPTTTGAENTGAQFHDHRGAEPDTTGAQNHDHEDVREDDPEDAPPLPPASGGRRRGYPDISRPDDFAAWWQGYPLQVGKLDAMKAWQELYHLLPPLAQLLEATINTRDRLLRTKGADWERFMPFPATWLRRGDFLDGEAEQLTAATPRACILCGVANPCPTNCGGVDRELVGSIEECLWA